MYTFLFLSTFLPPSRSSSSEVAGGQSPEALLGRGCHGRAQVGEMPTGLAASPWHLLCCGHRWRSPGASRCHPSGPSAAFAGSAGSGGFAARWPGHYPGFPRQPPARRPSARRCLRRTAERGGEGGGRVRPCRHHGCCLSTEECVPSRGPQSALDNRHGWWKQFSCDWIQAYQTPTLLLDPRVAIF
jgi:hypothetical protein